MRCSSRIGSTGLIAIALTMIGSNVRAAPEADEPYPAEIELQWSAPASCPDADAVRARISSLLTGPPGGEGTITVVGTIEEDARGFRLDLSTEFAGRTESRTLQAEACGELGESTALLLAFALEPGLEPSAEAPPVNTVPEPVEFTDTDKDTDASASTDTPTTATKSGTNTPPEPAFSDDGVASRKLDAPDVHLRAGGAVEFGALPGVSGGPRLAIGLGWPRVRFDVHGGYLSPRRDPRTGPGASYQAGVVGLRGCGLPRVGTRISFPLCVGAEGGAVRAATREFDPARTRHGPWIGALSSAGVAARFGRLGLWSAAEAVVVAYSGDFRIEGGSAWTSFPVSGRLVFGVELIVP